MMDKIVMGSGYKGLGSSSSSQVAKGNDNGKKVQGKVYALTTQDA